MIIVNRTLFAIQVRSHTTSLTHVTLNHALTSLLNIFELRGLAVIDKACLDQLGSYKICVI